MGTEYRITMNLEKLAKSVNFLIFSLAAVSVGFSFFYPSIFLYIASAVLIIINIVNFYYRRIQKKHTLLANFGILAQFRYIVESVGPEFRQYLYSSDTEGRPFNRTDRSDVYRKSKSSESSAAFGSLLNFNASEMKLKHSLFPLLKSDIKKFRLTFGEERNLKNAYTIHYPLMIGAMSYGALGSKAVKALTRGAAKANVPINTGEGGYPKHHLMEKGHLIFQMGTAKFGVRKPDGSLDENLLKKLSEHSQVKMIEIKLSQGAKPGKGGLLPKEKITKEIAELRGIPEGKDILSPPYHLECKDYKTTCLFIQRVQEASSLPVGIKLCLGNLDEFSKLIQEMKSLNIFPDYIALDGAEGGTGAAPKIFMDHIGYPIFSALPLVHQTLKKEGVRNKLKLVASGKLINSGKQMMALALGADAVYTARGFMLALGCIQALRCNNNSCPVGITTHRPALMRGLDIEDKSERVKNYVLNLNKDYYEILSALGEHSFESLSEKHVLASSH